ncbi:primosomal protein N' [Agromyces archimandritae]|uniref:Primosomal protein N n=1 Tax=Agromyces archimandritae TaxID=2781962 RepID=A0A975INH6_9MICO|nr:primosomal protein N' [Agromyces archimandritae]QTX04627.1 primosomal protein N' [Agromyces archimandritae]
MTAGPAVARVAVDSPLPQLDQFFDYAVPERLREGVRAGQRVRMPLRSGGRIAHGWIVELVEMSTYEGRLAELEDLVSEVPVLAPEVWRLARSLADRAAGCASDILRLAIPQRYVRAEKAWLAGDIDAGPLPADPPPVAGYVPGEVEAGIRAGERMTLAAVPRPVVLPGGATVGAWAVTLAEAAAHALAGDRSAILVVPDYRDQEQLEAALADRIPAERIVRTDARQPGAARFTGFLRASGEDARVIVGNRSAVYAPAARLGLIAIWDDGDPLHAEPLAPGVHARDAALMRQEQSGAALVFLGHTRTVEVQRLVEIGWVRPVPRERAVRPHVVVTAQQASATGPAAAARIPPTAWAAAGEAARHGPVLVQVAQPGYAPLLACADCGAAASCVACGGMLHVPARGAEALCRLCGRGGGDWRCAACEGTRLRRATVGSARTAEELGRAFPAVRIVRSDGERPVLAVDDAPQLVVATRGAEPVAAGGYRAVLLLDGERMLVRESLRVAEDCLRWWSNAAALAAADAPVYLVGVGGGLGRALATWRQDRWAAEELAARRELRFPPAIRVATVRAGRQVLDRTLGEAASLGDAVDVLGPVPEEGGEPGLERAILRVEYGTAGRLAAILKAEQIRVATARRRPVAGQPVRKPPTLRVRFDDPDVP